MPPPKRKPDPRQKAVTAAVITVGSVGLVIFAVLSGTLSNAATIVWANVGSTFSTAANWVGGVAPANNVTSDIGRFQGAVTNNPILTANRSIAGLEFASGTGAWNFSANPAGGDDTLTLGAAGIVNNSTSTQTFSNADLRLQLGANSTFSGASGALNFDSSVDRIELGGFDLTLSGGVGGTIGTRIIGTGNLIKLGTGTWTLSGPNTYSGTTTIGSANGPNAGALVLGANNVLPNTGVIIFGGVLDVNTRTDTIGALTMGGGAAGSTAQVLIGNGGVLTLGGDVTYNAANNPNGALISGTGTGALALGTAGRTFNIGDSSAAANDLTISAIISGGFGITKTGAGVLLLSGANTYTGTTSVGTAGGANGGTLSLGANNVLPGTAVNVFGGTLDVNTRTDTIGALNMGGGATGTSAQVSIGTGGVLTLGGTVTYNAANNPNGATISGAGTLALGGDRTFTVGDSTAAAVDLTVSTIVSGANTLSKGGAGVLVLSGSNSYTGTTTVNTGVLNIQNNNALGTTASGTTVVSGASLAVQGGITVTNETLSIAGTGLGANGALRNISGTNTWTGGITMTSASEIQSDAGRLNISSNVTAANLGLTVDGAGNTAASGTLALGTGGLAKTGTGTLFLTGSSTYTGGTLVSGGALQLGEGGTTGSLATNSTITNNGVLSFNRSDNIAQGSTFSGAPISGTGSLVKNGGGTLTLGVANTYSGQTTINSGALRITNASALGTIAGGTTVASGAALEIAGNIGVVAEPIITLNGSGIGGAGALRNISGSNSYGGLITLGSSARVNTDSGTLNFTNTGTITGAGHTLSFGGAGNTILRSEIATGTGGLVKDGTGTLILSGNNSYTGGTLISTGTLQVGNGGATGTIAAGSAITNNATLAFRVGASTRDIGSAISGTGNVVMDSPGGQVDLTASNSYTGGTTVLAGQLHAITANSFGTGSVTIAGTNGVNLAEIHYTNSVSPLAIGPLTLAGNAVVALNPGDQIQSSGAVNISSTNNFINISGNSWSQGTNILISGTSINLLSGVTNILLTGASLNGGTLALGSSSLVGRTTYTFNTNATSFFISTVGAPFDLLWTGAAGNNTWNTNSTNWRQATNGLNPVAPDIAFFEDDNVWFGAAATTSPITVVTNGVSAAEMSVTNTSGTVAFNGGQITAHNLNKTGAGNLVLTNALNLIGTIDPGLLRNTGSGNVTLAGAWTNGGLIQAGSGTVTLAVSNSFFGGTVISNGVVVTSANGALGNGSLLVNGGTLSMGTTTQTAGLVTLSNGAITGTGTLTGTDYHVENGTISVALAGAAGMTKSGTGTVVLSGANTFSGGLDIHDGVLQVSSDANLGATNGNVEFDQTGNGVLRTTAGFTSSRAFVFSTAGTIDVTTNALVLDGSLADAGTLIKTGAGTLVIATDNNNQSGGMLINAGVLQIGNGGAVGSLDGGSITNNAALTVNRTGSLLLTNIISGTGSLTNVGAGTLTLTAANSYTGPTVISAGTLSIGDGGTNGSLSTSSTITNNGTLILDRSDTIAQGTDFSGGALAGTGALVKNGAGSLILTASNTYTGATTINEGAINLQNNRGLGATNGGTTVASGAALELQGNISVTNETLTLAGTGVGGNGALRNISGTNTWTGATTLSTNAEMQSDSGRLIVSGPISSTNQGLTIDGAGNTTLAGTIGLVSGAITKNGAGTLTISGSNSSSGILSVNGGKLEVATNTSLGTGAISLDGGTLRSTGTFAITPSTRTMNIGTNGGTIETVAGTTLTYEGIMLGEGKLTKTGTGTFQTGQLANYNVAAAVGGVANAGLGIASYFNFDQLAVGTTNTTVAVTNSFGPTKTVNVTFTGNTGVRLGNSAGLWAAPFLSGGNGAGFGTNGTQQTNGVDSTPYLATGDTTNSTITFNLGTPVEYLGILWGSVDAGLANTLTFRDETNGILFTITGQEVLNSPNGDQGTNGTVYANINSDKPIYSIVATSPQRAFEFDNIAIAPQVLRTGPVDVLEGTFQIINAGFFNGIGTNDPVFVESGATFSFKGNTNLTQQTIGNLSGSGTVINEGAAAVNFRVNNSSNSTFSGVITDTTNNLNFVKLGAGTLTLSGNNTYDGSTVISNGVLQIGDGGTNGTLGRGAVTNQAGLVINRDGTYLLSNNIAGTGGLTNEGPGTVVLTGSNTWTGPTLVSGGTLVLSNTSGGQAAGGTSSIQVDSDATLVLGASNQIGNSTGLILNGGTFRVGTDTAGYSETLGTLTLNQDSVIDLGSFTGSHTLTFANSSGIAWATNATLTISNWQGTAWSPGTAGQILFGTGGLTSAQLSQIRWDPQGYEGAGLINGNGELTPIPEPRVYAAAIALLAAVGWRERKRLLGFLRRR